MSQKKVGLDAEQIAFFHENGYVVGDQLLRPDRFAALKAHFEETLRKQPEGSRPEDLDVPHFTDPYLFEWLMDSEVLDTVESIIGPDIAVFSSHFFCKPAGDGKSVPWHTDAYFWRQMIQPASEAITVWLALDPSTLKNGCMLVIPRSQSTGQGGQYSETLNGNTVFDEELDQSQVDSSEAVPIELQPNQFSIHAGGLVHSSARNLSNKRRCGFTMRYISTRVRFKEQTVGDRHQIFLARGEDRAGNQYASPYAPHPELVESRGEGQNFVGEQR